MGASIRRSSPLTMHLNYVLMTLPVRFGCQTGPVSFMVPHLARTIHSSLNNVCFSDEIRSCYFYGSALHLIIMNCVDLDPLAVN